MNIKWSFLKYAKSIGKNNTGNLAANEEMWSTSFTTSSHQYNLANSQVFHLFVS